MVQDGYWRSSHHIFILDKKLEEEIKKKQIPDVYLPFQNPSESPTHKILLITKML